MFFANAVYAALQPLSSSNLPMASLNSPQFTFSMMFDREDATVPQMFHVTGVGDIHVPVSLQDMERMRATAEPSKFGPGVHAVVDPALRSSWQIDVSQVFLPSPVNTLSDHVRSWMEDALSQPGIDVDAIGAEARLNGLILYESGGHYVEHCHLMKDSGHFATLYLQIPVERGHEGGRLTVKHQEKLRFLDLSHESHTNFYMTVVHVGSRQQMAPIADGWRMELVFHLLWKPPSIVVYPLLPDISSFLVALTKLKIELTTWLDQTESDGPPKFLILPLERNYDPKTHSFSTLIGQDRAVALLTRAANVLEVHLARLTRVVTITAGTVEQDLLKSGEFRTNTKLTRTVHSLSYWIGVDNCAAQFLNLDVDRQGQFVSPVYSADAKPDREDHSSHPNEARTRQKYHQTVLVLWPKARSFELDLYHRFDHLLDRTEQDRVSEAISSLRNVISHPGAWEKTEPRICRLLNLCLRYRAGYEALQLCQLMVEHAIGLPSANASILIADIEVQFGWSACEEVVIKLVNVKPDEQLIALIALAHALLDRVSIAGFVAVSQQIWNFLEQNPPTNNKRQALAGCVELLISMEECRELDKTERIPEFIAQFSSWNAEQQWQLVIDVLWPCQRTPSGKLLYLYLCRQIAENVTPYDKALFSLVADLVYCLLELDPPEFEVLSTFISNVCQPKVKIAGCNNYLLQALTSDLDSFDLPEEHRQQLLDARIEELSDLQAPEFSWEQKSARFSGADDYPTVEKFLHSGDQELTLRAGFDSPHSARLFAVKHFGEMSYCLKRGYSAMAEVTGTGKSARCRIVKTRDLFLALNSDYERYKDELCHLRNTHYDLEPPPLELIPHVIIQEEDSDEICTPTKKSRNSRKAPPSRPFEPRILRARLTKRKQ